MTMSRSRTIRWTRTPRPSVATSSLVILCVLVAASCSSDTDDPTDDPATTSVAPDASAASTASTAPTIVAPVADSVADSVPSTGLVRIDGPATVDTSFSGASPSEDGG